MIQKQRVTITAKNEQEYKGRIDDLLARGYEVEKEFPPEEIETRLYDYKNNSLTTTRKQVGSDVRKLFRAVLSREYERLEG